MSKQVYSIDSQEKFNLAMVVGDTVGSVKERSKYESNVQDWTYDIEFSDLAYTIYDLLKDTIYTNIDIITKIEEYFNEPFHLKSAENDEDYQDFWYGVECGDFFGLPTEENLELCNRTMKIFMDNMKYGFVHEVIQEFIL